MTKPRHIGSRLLVAIAVLMLGKPPCVGAVCCGSEAQSAIAVAPIEAPAPAPAQEAGSCCRANVKGAKSGAPALPSLSCDTAADDDCPCCRPAPSSPAGRTEQRTASAVDPAGSQAPAPLPIALVGPERRSPLPHGKPSPRGVAIYLRLAHLRN